MKKLKISIVFVIISIVLLSVVKILITEEHFLITESINDYNSEKYPILLHIFPNELPKNAEVIDFSYYDYWYEAIDVYLELKFYSSDEMNEYLAEIKGEKLSNKELYIEEKNVHNCSYTDIFLKNYITYSKKKAFTGYEIETKDYLCYKCNYAVLSYSYEELVVIHSYSRGHFRPNIHKHTPEYIKRFNVPTQDNYQRIFYLDKTGVGSMS